MTLYNLFWEITNIQNWRQGSFDTSFAIQKLSNGQTALILQWTYSVQDLIQDFKAMPLKFNKRSYHAGMLECALEIKNILTQEEKDSIDIVAGYSLGGGIVQVLSEIMDIEFKPSTMFFSFAGPHTCYTRWRQDSWTRTYLVSVNGDPITRIPRLFGNGKHINIGPKRICVDTRCHEPTAYHKYLKTCDLNIVNGMLIPYMEDIR